MSISLKVLIVDDSEDDAKLILRELQRSGFDPDHERVDNAEDMRAALGRKTWQIAISDNTMPDFNSFRALEIIHQDGIDLPFIIVSGTMSDDVAIEAMKAGANDFLLKTNLEPLAPAVERELRGLLSRQRRRQVELGLTKKLEILQTTFASISQGFAAYDSDLKLVAFNQNYVELCDYPPGLVYLGMSLEEVLRFRAARGDYGPGDTEELVEQRMHARKKGELHQFEFTGPKGQVVAVKHDPLPSGGYVTTCTDITEHKNTEAGLRLSEENLTAHVAELEDLTSRYEDQAKELAAMTEDLAAARDEAEHSDRTKSEFLAHMSHELRTPLNAIIGFTDMILSSSFGPIGNEKYLEYIEDINASGHHLLDLINDILDLSKVEAGKKELIEEEFDPAEVVHSCVDMMKGHAKIQAIGIETELPDRLPLLRADPRVLKQILLNMLTNAVKFTPERGKVTIKAWNTKKNGFVFQVIDTGIGIALKDIPKIMQPFTQIENDLSSQNQGTGLGIPLMKRLIELHGGSFDIQSEVGIGTTVTVRFPFERIVE